MSATTATRPAAPLPASSQPTARRQRGPAIGAMTLGAALATNSLLGPLATDVIQYPLSLTLLNQTIGLEAVSLFVVAPWSVLAGILTLRGHRAGPLLALAPALYTAYMFVQYVVGPEYTYYPGALALHLGTFIVSMWVATQAWHAVDVDRVPQLSPRAKRSAGAILLVMAAFIVSRYTPGFIAATGGTPLAAEFREDVSMFWTILFMDLGIIVPFTAWCGLHLVRGSSPPVALVYALLGWFVLVPISVAAMAVAMVLRDDPFGNPAGAGVFAVVAVLFTALGAWFFAPLVRTRRPLSPGRT